MVGDLNLSPANRAHLEAVTTQVRAFRQACQDVIDKHPDPQALLAREHLLITLGRIATELFTMSAVLARTNTQASRDSGVGQVMADVYCASVRNRLTGLWQQLSVHTEPDYARLSNAWLTSSELDFLVHTDHAPAQPEFCQTQSNPARIARSPGRNRRSRWRW